MTQYDESILQSLTEEERMALKEDDGGGETSVVAEDENEEEQKNVEKETDGKVEKESSRTSEPSSHDDNQKIEEVDVPSVDHAGSGDTDKSHSDDARDTSISRDQIIPLLVAEAPADAEEKLKEISDKKGTLGDQFDNGDITAKEYQTQLDTLNREERAIERQVDKAQTASEMRQQQELNTWLGQVKTFTSHDHPEYSRSRSRWMALDAFVKEIGKDPQNDNLSAEQILELAHQHVVDDLGEAPIAKAEGKNAKNDEGRPLKGSKIEAPKTLTKVPASDSQEITDGKFSALDRLAERDPLALEEKLMRMSGADRDEWLASRS
jgi:hypothetical protein